MMTATREHWLRMERSLIAREAVTDPLNLPVCLRFQRQTIESKEHQLKTLSIIITVGKGQVIKGWEEGKSHRLFELSIEANPVTSIRSHHI